METVPNKNKLSSYLIFKMMNEYFAINVGQVLSILEMQKITEVPESPAYMKGVINLRGDVLPVVDSHIKFGLSTPVEISSNTCILVLEVDDPNVDGYITLGLLSDEVVEVLDIPTDKIIQPPSIGESYKSKYITGLFKQSDESLVMLLDIDKLLTTSEIHSIIGNEEAIEVLDV